MRKEEKDMLTPEEMRRTRIALKMTQIDVARAVGVSVPAYRLWEAGGTRPTIDNESKLRQVLQLGRNDDATGNDDTSHRV